MTTETDLFGDPVLPPVKAARKRQPGQKAYPAMPGTGPEGKTCKDCQHIVRRSGSVKVFRKCALMRNRWTRGDGTDIKASSPACAKFDPATTG